MDNNELNDVIKELILKFKNTIPKENERLIEAFENYLLSILSECKNNNESKEFIIFLSDGAPTDAEKARTAVYEKFKDYSYDFGRSCTRQLRNDQHSAHYGAPAESDGERR